MSHTPVGGNLQGREHKLADRSSLPPISGEEKSKHLKHEFAQPQLSKLGEPDGSSASSARSSTSPPYLRWARTLQDLLADEEGLRLFRKFVECAGGVHVDRLNFYFVVQGLRQEHEPPKIRHIVHAIYRFLRKSELSIPEDLKARVKQSLKDGSHIDRHIFDDMEKEVTRAMSSSTYQAFLSSDAYVSYVSAATQPLSSPDITPPFHYKEVLPTVGGGLATVHEGQELGPQLSATSTRLTPDALRLSQTTRLLSESAPGSLMRKRSVYDPHLSYAGYCPGSRVDSERASLSSGRVDSDAVSLSGSSIDGMSIREPRESRESRHRPRLYGMDKHTIINKEHDNSGCNIKVVIPRTQLINSDQLRVLPPSEFAPLLIEKLERVKRDQDNKERLDRRLQEGDGEDSGTQALPPQLVVAAIREKLKVDDDNDQDILDQHVSRVWSWSRTPSRERSPRRRVSSRRPPLSLHTSRDSGLSEMPHSMRFSQRSFQKKPPQDPKKSSTELTDSGVSVVSYNTNTSVEPRILQWMAEGDRASSEDRDEHKRKQGGNMHKNRTAAPKSATQLSTTMDPPCTIVVITFLDENVPYRIKVPAGPLNLKTFKDYLPRKGNYRYFFKTECADLDNTVIQEEIINDNEVLPMFEGKVMARVKSVE